MTVTVSPGDNLSSLIAANPSELDWHINCTATSAPFDKVVIDKADEVTFPAGAVVRGNVDSSGDPISMIVGSEQISSGLFSGPDGNGNYSASYSGEARETNPNNSCSRANCDQLEELFIDDEKYFRVYNQTDVQTNYTDTTFLGGFEGGHTYAGSWYYDEGADIVYIPETASGKEVRVSIQNVAFTGSMIGVTFRNLRLAQFANDAQDGANDTQHGSDASPSTTWDNVWFHDNHGMGHRIAVNNIVTKCKAFNNGQMGAGGFATGCVVDNFEVYHNNLVGYNWAWEAGGLKYVGINGGLFRDIYGHHNEGTGIWFDINNRNFTAEYLYAYGNYVQGISHEIGYGAEFRYMCSEENGYDGRPWGWGGQIFNQNSSASGNANDNNPGFPWYHDFRVKQGTYNTSPDTVISIEQNRGNGIYGPYRSVGAVFEDGIIEYSGNYGGTGIYRDTTVYTPQSTDPGQQTWRRNRYYGVSATANRWTIGGARTWSGWQAGGYDVVGSTITNAAFTRTCASSGTLVGSPGEADIVAGGLQLTLILDGSFWRPSIGEDNQITQDLINGLDSDGSDPAGWDAVVKAGLDFNDVEFVDARTVRITLPPFPTYGIASDENVSITVPAQCLVDRQQLTATGFTIAEGVVNPSASLTTTIGDEQDIRDGSATITVTVTNDELVKNGATAMPEVEVATGNDDAEEKGDGSGFSNSATTITLDSSTTESTRGEGGIRFQLNVPKGAIINTSTLEVWPVTDDDPDVTITAEATDNSVNFVDTADINGRTDTTASVAWDATAIGTGGYFSSPDISAVIQEIVNRAGWQYGNYITILIRGLADTNKLFDISSRDSGATQEPKLNVNYTPLATFDSLRQNIWDEFVGDLSGAGTWNDEVNSTVDPTTAIVRTSDTVYTITLSAVSTYDIVTDETVVGQVPGSALQSGTSMVPIAESITITSSGATSATLGGTLDGSEEAAVRTGGLTTTITLSGTTFADDGGGTDVAQIGTTELATSSGGANPSLSPTLPAGSNRYMLAYIAYEDLTAERTLSSLTFGGQAMTLLESTFNLSGGFYTASQVWGIKEAGLAAASGTALAYSSWDTIPDNAQSISTTFFQNVDQTTSVADSGVGNTNGTTISLTAPMSVTDGDAAFYGGNHQNPTPFGSTPTGYTEEYDSSAGGTMAMVAGFRIISSTGTTDPEIVWDESGRVAMVGVVLAQASGAGGFTTAQQNAILDGFSSDTNEASGFNHLRTATAASAVVRTSETLATISWATDTGFGIANNETVTHVLDSSAINSGGSINTSGSITLIARKFHTMFRSLFTR